MKRLFMFTAGLALLATTAFGQEKNTSRAQYVSLGPVAGFGHSWLNNMDGQQFKPAGHLGVNVIYSRFEHWGFGAELTASHEGYKRNFMQNGIEYTTAVDPTYVKLTPRAYYFFGKYTNAVRPKIFLGPSVGVKVAEDHYQSETRIFGDGPIMTINNSDVFNTWDVGADVGAGANIRLMPSTWLNLDAAYYHGFLDVTDMNNSNRNVRLNVGLMFGL